MIVIIIEKNSQDVKRLRHFFHTNVEKCENYIKRAPAWSALINGLIMH
jgi:hypothetical protein